MPPLANPVGDYAHPDDKFYHDLGVTPPSHTANGTAEFVSQKLSEESQRKHGNWTQQGMGGPIECHACEYVHGHVVGMDDMLMGTDNDGNPIIKKLVL